MPESDNTIIIDVEFSEQSLTAMRRQLHDLGVRDGALTNLNREARALTPNFQSAQSSIFSAATAIKTFVAARAAHEIADIVREGIAAEKAFTALRTSAQSAGVTLAQQAQSAERLRKELALTRTEATSLQAQSTFFAKQAGSVSEVDKFTTSLADLAVAKGRSLAELSTLISQLITGVDEATDKLFGVNPTILYAEYARTIGKTAESLTDAEKAQVRFNKVVEEGAKFSGTVQDFMSTTAGQVETATAQWRDLKTTLSEFILSNGLVNDTLALTNELLALVTGRPPDDKRGQFRDVEEAGRSASEAWGNIVTDQLQRGFVNLSAGSGFINNRLGAVLFGFGRRERLDQEAEDILAIRRLEIDRLNTRSQNSAEVQAAKDNQKILNEQARLAREAGLNPQQIAELTRRNRTEPDFNFKEALKEATERLGLAARERVESSLVPLKTEFEQATRSLNLPELLRTLRKISAEARSLPDDLQKTEEGSRFLQSLEKELRQVQTTLFSESLAEIQSDKNLTERIEKLKQLKAEIAATSNEILSPVEITKLTKQVESEITQTSENIGRILKETVESYDKFLTDLVQRGETDNPFVRMFASFRRELAETQERFAPFGAAFLTEAERMLRAIQDNELALTRMQSQLSVQRFEQEARRLETSQGLGQSGPDERAVEVISARINAAIQGVSSAAIAESLRAGVLKPDPVLVADRQLSALKDLESKLGSLSPEARATAQGRIDQELKRIFDALPEEVRRAIAQGGNSVLRETFAGAFFRDTVRAQRDVQEAIERERVGNLIQTQARELLDVIHTSGAADGAKLKELLNVTGALGEKELTPDLRAARVDALRRTAVLEASKERDAKDLADKQREVMDRLKNVITDKGIKLDGDASKILIEIVDRSDSSRVSRLGRGY